jgi:hypothetical protein
MRYFITFACYGDHLHGNESGSVEPQSAGKPFLGSRSTTRLSGTSEDESGAVLARPGQPSGRTGGPAGGLSAPLLELAAHVRTNHVHVAVEAEVQPEKVMNNFKSCAGRSLNRLLHDGADRKRWARHGSTRWLWKDRDVREAIRYVVEEQGEPMAVFVADAV